MRATVAKKLRKYAKRNWIEYVQALEKWPYRARFRFAWYLINPIRALKQSSNLDLAKLD